jgi:hypothetical protein
MNTVQDGTSLTDYRSAEKTEFPPWPYFADDEIGKVSDVLRSGKVNYWTGNEVREFEKEFATACGTKYAIAMANGTVALEAALHGLGIGKGDEVVVTPRTFVASAGSIVNCGAIPVFADVDPLSGNISPDEISAVISPRTKAIIAVHLAGWPCEMDAINSLAASHNLNVIEDCSQAHGATYKGRPAGSLGDVGTYSFCQDKIMTTGGEGGMLVTSDSGLWQKAWSRKEHGKDYYAAHAEGPASGFRWVHEQFGTNWRMTEMQGAIGRLQLRKLPDWLGRRRRNAAFLSECFRHFPALHVLEPPRHIGHAYYKYYVLVQPEHLAPGWDRDGIVSAIKRQGVPCFSGSCSEVYLEASFRKSGLQPAQRLPVARDLGERSLMFLVHPTLGDADISRVCQVVSGVIRDASLR